MKSLTVDDEYILGRKYRVGKFFCTGATAICFDSLDREGQWHESLCFSSKNARVLGKAMIQMAEENEADLEKQWDIYRATKDE